MPCLNSEAAADDQPEAADALFSLRLRRASRFQAASVAWLTEAGFCCCFYLAEAGPQHSNLAVRGKTEIMPKMPAASNKSCKYVR